MNHILFVNIQAICTFANIAKTILFLIDFSGCNSVAEGFLFISVINELKNIPFASNSSCYYLHSVDFGVTLCSQHYTICF